MSSLKNNPNQAHQTVPLNIPQPREETLLALFLRCLAQFLLVLVIAVFVITLDQIHQKYGGTWGFIKTNFLFLQKGEKIPQVIAASLIHLIVIAGMLYNLMSLYTNIKKTWIFLYNRALKK